MKKHAMVKRILSAFLAIVLVVGMITVSEPNDVEAANTNIEIDFASVDGGGNWSFSVSGLPSNAAQCYRFTSVEVDGAVQENTVWMEISGSTIVIWNGGCDNGMPTTSLRIPAGTVLKEADPWTVVAGGQTLTITNDLYIANNNGTWEKQTLSAANEIQMDFVSVDGGGNWSFSVTGLPSNAAQYYRFTSVEVDGVVQNNTVWMEISGGNIVIWNGGCDNGMPTTSLKIPAGTELKEADPWTVVAGGKTLTITNDLYIVNNNGTWEKSSQTSVTPEDHTTMANGGSGMPQGAANLIENGDFDNEIVNSNKLGNTAISGNMLKIDATGTDDYFQLWGLNLTSGKTYKLTYYIWVNDANALQYNMFAAGASSPAAGDWLDFVMQTSITANTTGWQKVEVEWTASATGEAVIGFKNYNNTGNATIYIDDIALYDTDIAARQITVSLHENTNSSQVWFATSDDIANYYGDWSTASAKILVDGVETDKYFSIVHGLMYVEGLDNAQKLEIPANTEFAIYANAENKTDKTSFKVTNGMELEKEGTTWKLADSGVPAPTPVITDCQVTAYELWPNQSADYCQVVVKTDVDLQALYPDQALTGEIKIGDTAKSVTWYIGTNLIYTVGITYDEFMTAERMTIETDSVFELTTDPTKKVKFTKGLELINKNGTWISSDVNVVGVPINDYELWRKGEFYQLILKSSTDLRTVTNQPISGYVYIDGNKKQVEWYVDESTGAVYTVGITLEEGDSAKRIQIPKESLFTILNDSANVLEITKELKLIQIDGIWMLDEGQTKIDYNEVKISFSSSDGRGFYLNAEIISGPDKGKDIGGADVYGNWLTTATGAMSYNGGSTVDAFWSPTEKMIYISGDYDPTTMTSIQLKKGTVLRPSVGAPCSTMMRLANDLNLAFDARYNRWVLAGDENKQYTFNEVKVEVARVTGAELELQGTFTKMSGKKLMDIYGDWVNLIGEVILGDPDKGTYTNNGVAYSLAGTSLIIYGIQPGLMDTIEIKAGTILWPDSSCKSQDPIRIANDIVMVRDAEDEWVIKAGKMTTKKNGSQDKNTTVQSEQKDVVQETLASYDDGPTKVRLVDKDEKNVQDGKQPVGSGNVWGYIGISSAGIFAVALITGLILFSKKRKKGEGQTVK